MSDIYVHGETGRPYMAAPDPANISAFVTVQMESGKSYGDYLGLMYDFQTESWIDDIAYQNSRKAALADTDGSGGMVNVDGIKLPIDGASRQRMLEILVKSENPDSTWWFVDHKGLLVTVTRDQLRRALGLAINKHQNALEVIYAQIPEI